MALAPALFISPVGNAEVRVAGQRGAGSPLPDEDGRYMDCVEVSCLRLLEALGARPRDEARDGAEPPPLAPEEVAAELATDLLSAAQLSPVFEPGVVFDISALEARGASAEVVDFMRARHGARIGSSEWLKRSAAGLRLRTAWAELLNERPEVFVYNRPRRGYALTAALKPLRGPGAPLFPARADGRYEVQANVANHAAFIAFVFPRAAAALAELGGDAHALLPMGAPAASCAAIFRALAAAVGGLSLDCERSTRTFVCEAAAAVGANGEHGEIADLETSILVGGGDGAPPFWRWKVTQVTEGAVRRNGHSEIFKA